MLVELLPTRMYGALHREYTLVESDFEQKMLGSFLGPMFVGFFQIKIKIFIGDTLLSETFEFFGKILILTTTGADLVNM